jgi:DNA replication and repair protein RecF
VQVINAQSFELLTGPPAARRQYLDWGVFHVEPAFFPAWQLFQRHLKQRNRLLRHDKIGSAELSAWTVKLADCGDAVARLRAEYVEAMLPFFQAVVSALLPELAETLNVRYAQGWDSSLSFAEALEQSYEGDRQQGYTRVGPQRADLKILTNGQNASEILSRGQQKLVVCALKLAQGQLLSERDGSGEFMYLVDDLPSELDKAHSRYVCKSLSSLAAQVFITAVDSREVTGVWPDQDAISVFHVEHGTVSAEKQQTHHDLSKG